MIDEAWRQFVKEHAADDTSRLLLSASRFPEVDVPSAVEQIRARRQIRDKLPAWYADDRLVFPTKVAAEQCSSEQTALYKQRLVEKDATLCDLTGGLGVDCYFFSRKVKRCIYIERFGAYCAAARHNLAVLGADNVEVVEADAEQQLALLPSVDLFYIDPARRGEGNRRVFALQDCEPDLPRLLPSLLARAPLVIAKLSPMADVRLTLDLLPQTTDIHILSVKNECKELLFVMQRGAEGKEPELHCVHFAADGREETFCFTNREEQQAPLCLSDGVGAYLYEPNASLLKAGAFKVVAARMGVRKLQASSHLYTSDSLVEGFPGRTFRVEAVLPFTAKLCKTLGRETPQANITTRNFPLSVEALRQRTKIGDGGSVYLFATTLADGGKVLVKCTKNMGDIPTT